MQRAVRDERQLPGREEVPRRRQQHLGQCAGRRALGLIAAGVEPADEIGKLDFGIEHRAMENLGRTAFDQTLLEGGWGIANPGDIPDEFIEPINYADLFDGYSTNSK